MIFLTQLLANTIATTAVIALVAIGFSLILQVGKFFNFAHGIFYTIGAYFAFALRVKAGLPLFIAIPTAVLLVVQAGCLIELLIYRPLRHRGASALVLLLTSLGSYIVLQNVVAMVFGDDTKQLRSGGVIKSFAVLGARLTSVQIATILVSTALVAGVGLLLRNTKLGQAMRAVATDAELASVSGVESDQVILWTFAIASGLAGVAGVLVALDVDMTPTMGMRPLMLGVVAVIIGGVGRTLGLVAGALLLAAAQQLGAWHLGSQWQDVTAFVILLAFLLARPQGILGRKSSKASV